MTDVLLVHTITGPPLRISDPEEWRLMDHDIDRCPACGAWRYKGSCTVQHRPTR